MAKKNYFNVDYKEINDLIKGLKPGKNIVIRFFNYTDKEYLENAYVTIKPYKHYGYRRFAMKAYYVNSKDNKIQQSLIECMGHSYELKFNSESVKWGMRWSIRNAIQNTLHICYSHIYDYPVNRVIVFDDSSLFDMQDAVDKFINQVKDNYESPRSQMFVAENYPRINVVVTIRPSYANIKVSDHYNKEFINYPLYPIAASRKAISVSHPKPICKLINMIITKAYLDGLYSHRYETQYVFSQLLPGIDHVHYKVQTNPETEVIQYADYTVENMTKKFVERLHATAAPFVANMFRYEYAFSTMKKHKGYVMKIGVLIIRDFAAIYAFETPDDSDKTVAVYSKVISDIPDGFNNVLIHEHSKPTSSGINVHKLVDLVGEYVESWMKKAKDSYII